MPRSRYVTIRLNPERDRDIIIAINQMTGDTLSDRVRNCLKAYVGTLIPEAPVELDRTSTSTREGRSARALKKFAEFSRSAESLQGGDH